MATIKIIDSGLEKYSLKSDTNVLGRMYDNNAEAVAIIIPETEAESVCYANVVSCDGEAIDRIKIENNSLPISSNLTQYCEIYIGFSFIRPDDTEKQSEQLKFGFLYAIKPKDFTPEQSDTQKALAKLMASGFTKLIQDGDTVEFYNWKDNAVGKIHTGGQSDYNQNDSTAADYIKNRPFYEAPAVVFDENVTTEKRDGAEFYVWGTTNKVINANVGDEIKVIFNGIEYTQTAKVFEEIVIYVGNVFITGLGEDTKEPFFIALNLDLLASAEGPGLGVSVLTQSAYNGEVKIIANDVKTIDPKFIKDMYYETTTETELFNGVVDITKEEETSVSEIYYSGTLSPSFVVGVTGDKCEVTINETTYMLDVAVINGISFAGTQDFRNGIPVYVQTSENVTTIGSKTSYVGANVIVKNIHANIKQVPIKYIPQGGEVVEITINNDNDETIASALENYLKTNTELGSRLRKANEFTLVCKSQGDGLNVDRKYHFISNYSDNLGLSYRGKYFQCIDFGNNVFADDCLLETFLLINTDNTVLMVEGTIYDTVSCKFQVGDDTLPNEEEENKGKLGFFWKNSDGGKVSGGNTVSLSDWIKYAQQRADFAIPTPTKGTDLVDKNYVDNNKGGTIPGDVIITGDLTVNGTQHINNTENLNVENAMIYSNAKGATLAANGGVGIKKNATDVYGIVYDPTSDSVKLGLGKSNANGVFTFNANEGQPVAIRDDSSKFNANHFIKWNEEQKKLVDSGYLAEDFVDVATQQTIAGMKTFTDEVHFGTTHFNKDLNVDNAAVKIFDNLKDLVTRYKADSIVIDNGTGSSAVQHVLTLPKETGTLLLNKFKYSTFGSSNDGDSWNLTDGTKNLEIKYQDANSHSSIFLEKDYIELSDINGTGSAKVSLASNVITLDTVDSSDKHKIIRINPDKVSIGNSTDTPLVEIDSLSAKFSNRPQVKDNGNYVDVALKSDLDNYVPTQSESADKYYAQITNENGIISARIFQNGGEDVQNVTIDKNGVKVLGKNIATTEQVDGKVDKLPSSLINQVYVRNANGEDTGLAYTYTDEGGTLAVRNASGQLQVSDPSQDKDATNKSYADNLNARYVSTSILGG